MESPDQPAPDEQSVGASDATRLRRIVLIVAGLNFA